jgi:putative ABC transport system substrate-binding protein
MVRTLILIFLLQYGLVRLASAQERDLLILYPEAANPYQKVYQQIIDGIRSSIKDDLHTLALAQDHDLDKARRWLDKNKSTADALVVLGNRALKAAGLLNQQLPLVVGAVDILPGKDRIPGVSIRIHPADYLEHLRLLSPNSTKVVVFYNEHDKELVPLIESEARKRDITITPIPVTDVTDAIRSIAAVLKNADPANTAIWFARNVIELNTELLYPYILEESWNRHIPVFSTMISHTKRGFLFSLYPDYQGMGEALGHLIEAHVHSGIVLKTAFCPAVKFALNIRTIQHLGLTPSDRTLGNVDLTFPAWQTTD